MFCRNCGNAIDDNSSVCPNCGASQVDSQPVNQSSYNYGQANGNISNDDNGGFGWGLLGCCIPVVGLILFLVWNKEKPKTAKAAGIGALTGVIISFLFVVVWYAFLFMIGITFA